MESSVRILLRPYLSLLLLLKENDRENAEYLNRMVREVNSRQVAPEEILSNHVYRYFTEEERVEGIFSE